MQYFKGVTLLTALKMLNRVLFNHFVCVFIIQPYGKGLVLDCYVSFTHATLNVPKCSLGLVNITVSLICYYYLSCQASIRGY